MTDKPKRITHAAALAEARALATEALELTNDEPGGRAADIKL